VRMVDELGDVLWYVSEIASCLGVTLEHVAEVNVEKLRKRYPNGFDPLRSMNRTV
jgi:NTP pyrophosphatase (non-canonical NTP hydrolase)